MWKFRSYCVIFLINFSYFRIRIEKIKSWWLQKLLIHLLVLGLMNGSSIMFLINIMWRFVCLQTNIQRMRKSLRISCRILLLSCGRSEKIFFYLHQVKSFLYTAVRNKALNELEHSKVVFEYAQKVIEKRKDSFFHDAVVEEETCRMLTDAIDKLPDQMRAIMRLAMEGKKNGEIAEYLNVSVETVHTLKKIAYKKLRIYLKDYYYFLILFYL